MTICLRFGCATGAARSVHSDAGDIVSKEGSVKRGSHDRKRNAVDLAKSTAKLALELAKETSDVFPPLKAATAGLVFIIQNSEKASSNYTDAMDLLKQLRDFVQKVGEVYADDPEARQSRETLTDELQSLVDRLSPMQVQNCVTRFIKASDNASSIQQFIVKARNLIQGCQFDLAIRTEKKVAMLVSMEHVNLLGKLKRAEDAGVNADNRSSCLEGTRTEILHEIHLWANDSSSQQIYWLNGHAGSGKTTIAQSFGLRTYTAGELGASFFCSRDSQDRSNINKIFPTLAHQIALSSNPKAKEFRESLCDEIAKNPDIASQSLMNQIQDLIIRPLKASGLSTLIIIDALDECRDDKSTSTILQLLANNIGDIRSLKVFITSRPEPHIRAGFHLEELKRNTQTILLHEMRGSLEKDIALFLEKKLVEAVASRSDVKMPHKWPRRKDVVVLTKKCDGLFIFAATAVKFIDNKNYTPDERLQALINSDSSALEGSSGLDALYHNILERGFSESALGDQSFLQQLRSVLGLLVVAQEPLCLPTITHILNTSDAAVRTKLRSLHSLILFPAEPNKPIRFHHKSFPDFLTDPSRCTDASYQLSANNHHFETAKRCLEIMKQGLRKNIQGLPRYSTNTDRDPADASIDPALQYACRYWADHLLADRDRDQHLEDTYVQLEDFAINRQLWWFEVLGLLHELRVAVHSLNAMREWLLSHGDRYAKLATWITDGQKFILNVFDLVQVSVAHIYHSALPITPRETPIRERHANDLDEEVRVLKGVGIYWDGNFRTIQAPGTVIDLTFSYNGLFIAAGGGHHQGFSQLFQSGTGELVATLDIQAPHPVKSLTFSCDDQTLATASGSVIKLWDVQTGALQSELQGDGRTLRRILFHPFTAHLLVSSTDHGSIRLWDTTKKVCLHAFSEEVHGAAICWLRKDDQNTILAGTDQGQLTMWAVDPPRRIKVFEPPVPSHPDAVCSVSCSIDASHVAAGSVRGTLLIYNVGDGHLVKRVVAGSSIVSLHFSPLDANLVTFAAQRAMHLMSLSDDRVVPFVGHGDDVNVVAFSPNGRFIASGSSDKTINVWETGVEDLNPDNDDHHSDRITCAHFSHRDGGLIVSGSDDTTVRVWDATRGSLIKTFHGHAAGILDAVFLSDNLHIISVDNSGRVFVWHLDQIEPICIFEDALTTSISALFPREDSSGFLTSHVTEAQTQLCWWTFNRNGADQSISLAAMGSIPAREYIIQLRPAESILGRPGPLMVECSSGNRYAVVEDSGSSAQLSNQALRMQLILSEHITHTTSTIIERTLIGAEQICHQTRDFHWIIDGRGRKILWVPPVCRGLGRWHGKNLVLEGNSGRFTLLDFSGVDLEDDGPF